MEGLVGRQVASGVLTAAILAFLGLLWNWGTNGGLIRLLGGVTKAELPMPAPNDTKFRIIQQAFNNQPEWAQITDSSKALFCALTTVDDDAPQGSCEVNMDDQGRWLVRSGGDGTINGCRVACLTTE